MNKGFELEQPQTTLEIVSKTMFKVFDEKIFEAEKAFIDKKIKELKEIKESLGCYGN